MAREGRRRAAGAGRGRIVRRSPATAFGVVVAAAAVLVVRTAGAAWAAVTPHWPTVLAAALTAGAALGWRAVNAAAERHGRAGPPGVAGTGGAGGTGGARLVGDVRRGGPVRPARDPGPSGGP
ncbi:hypothetical protein [Streptomyces sp. NPDC048606]|uniref:hypothetical protein n=1 Tax=Streptomyces sp. NPDC048606 TaxID=3154726 RepID=UPI0034257865